MANDSILNGYDEIVAITQNTINSQFRLLCPSDNSGPIHTQWQMLDPNDPQGQQGLYVTGMQPPTVSVLQPDNTTFEQGAMSMTLNLTSGALKYYDYGTLASIPIDGWTITFRCTLGNLQLVGDEALSQISAPQEATSALSQYLSSEYFTVAALFTLFESAAVSAAEVTVAGDAALSPTQQGVLLTMLDAYLTSLQDSGTPFVIGYAVQSSDGTQTLPEAPTFAPTACEFSNTPDPWSYQPGDSRTSIGLSTVNYLMMTAGRPFPTSATRQVFDFNWVTESQYQGAFAIEASLFRTGYIEALLLPILRQGLAIPSDVSWLHYPSSAGGAGSYAISYTSTKYDDDNDGRGKSHAADGNTVYERDALSTQCTVTVSPGPGQIVFTGQGTFYEKATFSAYTLFGIQNEVGWCSASLSYTFTITLAAGTDGAITSVCTFSNQPIVTDSHEDPLYVGVDWLVGLFDGDTLSGHLASAQTSLDNTLTSSETTLDNQTASALAGLSATILLPNGSVFFYKDMLFDAQQNVILHCTYKD